MESTTRSLHASKGLIRKQSGFSLVELMIVLIVGSAIIATLLSTILSVMRGSGGLSHYTQMKSQADRLISNLQNDVQSANRLDFITPGTDEILAFDLYFDDTWIAGYSYGVDDSPPGGLDTGQTWYQIWRHPSGGSRYAIARGLQPPPGVNFAGYAQNPVQSFFFFYNDRNLPFNHATYAGRRRAELGASKIQLTGTLQRGRTVDYETTHELSSYILLRSNAG